MIVIIVKKTGRHERTVFLNTILDKMYHWLRENGLRENSSHSQLLLEGGFYVVGFGSWNLSIALVGSGQRPTIWVSVCHIWPPFLLAERLQSIPAQTSLLSIPTPWKKTDCVSVTGKCLGFFLFCLVFYSHLKFKIKYTFILKFKTHTHTHSSKDVIYSKVNTVFKYCFQICYKFVSFFN